MTERELRRMSRTELLELLIQQGELIEQLQTKLSAAEKAVNAAEKAAKDRKLELTEIGSIAEAALKLNGVFEAADKAVKQYVEGVKRVSLEQAAVCERREAESKREAERILAEARQESVRIRQEATLEAQSNMNDKILSLRNAFEALMSIPMGDGNGTGDNKNNPGA